MANDYSSFMQTNEDGSIQSLDTAKMQSFIDAQISKGVDSFKAKFEKEQAKANMSEQEKFEADKVAFAKEREDFLNTMKAQKIELITEKAKARLEKANFSEAEVNVLTKFITEDEKTSLDMIDSLVAERQKSFEENKKKVIEEIQSKQPKTRTTSNSNADNGKTSEVVKRTSADIKNIYK